MRERIENRECKKNKERKGLKESIKSVWVSFSLTSLRWKQSQDAPSLTLWIPWVSCCRRLTAPPRQRYTENIIKIYENILGKKLNIDVMANPTYFEWEKFIKFHEKHCLEQCTFCFVLCGSSLEIVFNNITRYTKSKCITFIKSSIIYS